MHVTEIAFSVYAVTDLKRARGFYEGRLGLKPVDFPGCRMAAVLDPDGNTLTIHRRKAANP